MSLEYLHDIDDEIVEYIQNRFHRWETTLETIEGAQRVRIALKDGQEATPEKFIDVFWKYSNIFNKKQLVENILAQGNDFTAPVIIVSPQTPELLDRERTITEDDVDYDSDTETVTLLKGKRRIQMNYQFEAISKRYTDHRLMQSLLEFRLFSRSTGAYFIELFDNRYSIIYNNMAESPQEERNLFRHISNVGVQLELYTLPSEVVESVESVITSLDNENP